MSTNEIKPIRVSRDQISAARALILLRGGVDKVDRITAKIAAAEKPKKTEVHKNSS
jgi:hypothetical protein